MNLEYHKVEVTDRRSFVRFLSLLQKDYLQNGAEWENRELGSFLEAMVRYNYHPKCTVLIVHFLNCRD